MTSSGQLLCPWEEKLHPSPSHNPAESPKARLQGQNTADDNGQGTATPATPREEARGWLQAKQQTCAAPDGLSSH